MQTSKTVYWKTRTVIEILREGYPFFIMFGVYIIGILIGVIMFLRNDALSAFAADAFESFNSKRIDSTFIKVYFNALLSWLPFLAAVFVCGISITGVAITPIVISFCGFLYGLITAHLYSSFSLNGILYVLIIMIPPALIGNFCLFFAGKHAFGFSLLLTRQVMPEPRAGNLFSRLTRYCKQFVFLLLIAAFSALLEAVLSVSFIDKISIM